MMICCLKFAEDGDSETLAMGKSLFKSEHPLGMFMFLVNYFDMHHP